MQQKEKQKGINTILFKNKQKKNEGSFPHVLQHGHIELVKEFATRLNFVFVLLFTKGGKKDTKCSASLVQHNQIEKCYG